MVYTSDILIIVTLWLWMSKIYKAVFTASIDTLALGLKFPCVVSITWRRGQKIAEVKEKKQIVRGVATFGEPLELECNMSFDSSSKTFLEKKTRFTVLIFSQKGNKQAGQVNLDVAEFLNAKQKLLKYEKTLEKCPDKNAKLTFTLTAYIKEEIQPDAVSQKSANSIAPEASALTQSFVQQPDFKKKKQEDESSKSPEPQMMKKAVSRQKSQGKQRVPTINKLAKEKLKLQEQNRRLKGELEELKQLQIQNATLRRRYEEAEKKSLSYYSKKLEEVKKERSESKQKAKGVQLLLVKKQAMEKDMCNCKQQMGRILNFAMTSGNNEMAEEIYTIYQTVKP